MRKKRKFKRKAAQRKALMKSLTRELFLKGKIITTLSKAKEVSSFAQKQIEKAKKGSLHHRRLLLRYFSKDVVKKLLDEIAPRYKDRKGGYIRIIKYGRRNSDAAEIAQIELV